MYSSGGDGGASVTEAQRQARIDAGQKIIGRIIDGGTYGTGVAKSYTPGAKYYNAEGQLWEAPKGVDPAFAASEAIKQNQLFTGTTTRAGYGEDYYQKRADDYLKTATPQMMDQYRTTKNNLTFALARNGILNSGAAVQRNGALSRELATQRTQLASNAQGQANAARAQVADLRSNLVNQLVASGDPSLVAGQANAATAGLRAPSPVQPLGNLFQDWTNTYLANMNARYYDESTPNLWQKLAN